MITMKIKLILTLLAGMLTGISLYAQENNEAKTLFGNQKSLSAENLGFFVVPSYGITSMDGSSASLFNLRGGLNIQDKISLGAYFSTSINEIRPQSETIPNVYMDYWSVGGLVEYTLLSKNLVHFTFPLIVGYGEVEMDNENGDPGLGEANFLKIEPSALLEINLLKYVRFNIGAGYRFVGELNYRNFNQSDISGLTGYVALKIGLFR